MENQNKDINQKNVVWFKEVTKKDVELVGGKNGSLGDLVALLSEQFQIRCYGHSHILKNVRMSII